jgi:hypothetical protein
VRAVINPAAMALPAAMAFLLVTNDAAVAQSGSTGGTLGKVNKSASGGGQDQAPAAHVRSAVHNRAASAGTQGPRHSNSLAAYNGAWAGASFGQCIINGWSWNLQIDSGNISGANVTGKVSQGGGVSGAMTAFGSTYDFRGHLKASQGSGTWLVRSGAKAGCAGTWTIVKS